MNTAHCRKMRQKGQLLISSHVACVYPDLQPPPVFWEWGGVHVTCNRCNDGLFLLYSVSGNGCYEVAISCRKPCLVPLPDYWMCVCGQSRLVLCWLPVSAVVIQVEFVLTCPVWCHESWSPIGSCHPDVAAFFITDPLQHESFMKGQMESCVYRISLTPKRFTPPHYSFPRLLLKSTFT